VAITGLTADEVSSGGLVVWLGAVATPALAREDGSVVTQLPVFLNEDGWHDPTGPLDVRVERSTPGGEVILGLAARAVTVEALDAAPDAGERLVTAWTIVIGGLRTMVTGFPVESAEDTQHLTAQLDALDEWLLSGEHALAHILDGTAPLLAELPGEPLPALGAALAMSSGIVAEAEALAAKMEASLGTASLSPQAGGFCPFTAPDELLACKMQLYVVVKEFGQTVVAPTAKAWGEVTAVTGIAGIAVNIPAQAAIGFSLTVADLVINRLVVALLPATIEEFTLEFEGGPTVRQGDRITGKLELTAKNDPPNLTTNDLLALAMGAFDVKGGFGVPGDMNDELVKYGLKTVEYFLGIYANTFAAYADANPDLNLSANLTAVPEKTWGPTLIEDFNLFDAHSFSADILAVYEETPASPMWEAPADVSGDARVNVRTGGNEGQKVVWSGYTAGAFGENVMNTETLTVCVDDAPELTAVTTVVPTVVKAETETDVSFTLQWRDHCDNLERLYATFDLDGFDPRQAQYDVTTSPQVAGFTGTDGQGSLVETLWVYCDQRGKEHINATFYLLDEYSQVSEERSAFLLVDYGGCP